MSDIAKLVTHLTGAPVVRVYETNQVPATVPPNGYPYVVVALSYAAPGVATVDGHKSTPRRLTVRVFARTAAALDAWCGAVDARMNGRALPLTGSPVAEFEMSAEVQRDPDDAGVLGALMTYKF